MAKMKTMIIFNKASVLAVMTLLVALASSPGVAVAATQTEDERLAMWEQFLTQEAQNLARGDDLSDWKLPDDFPPPLELNEDLLAYFKLLDMENGMINNLIKTQLKSAIDGEQYECDNPTQIEQYIRSLLADLAFIELIVYFILTSIYNFNLWPLLATYFFEVGLLSDFYPDKQQENLYRRRLSDLNNFWDTKSENIQIGAIDMNLILDEPLMLATLQVGFGYTDMRAKEVYDRCIFLIEFSPAVGLDFPLHTLNAIAFSDDLSSPDNNVILIGNGLAQYMEDYLGIDAGMEYVLFHEFAHHVQYSNDIPEFSMESSTPENTRSSELMADALAAYYGHHPRGATFQTKRIIDMMEAAYSNGDCNFVSSGHHGTPNQREKAVEFAVNLIDNIEGGKGKILPSAEFIELFRAAYDDIIAPDAV